MNLAYISKQIRLSLLLIVTGLIYSLQAGAVFAQSSTLTLSIETNNPAPHQGELFEYVVEASAVLSAPDTAVKLTLPPGMSVMSYEYAGGVGARFDVVSRVWQTGTLDPTYNTNLTLLVRYDGWTSGQALTASAATANAYATVDIIASPAIADLQLTQTVDNAIPNVGDTIEHTILLSNAGPSISRDVEIALDISPGLSIVSSRADIGRYDRATNQWQIDFLEVGETFELTLKTEVTDFSQGALSVLAEITNSSALDYRPGNESSPVHVDAPADTADLAIAASTSAEEVGEVNSFAYTVSLSNDGDASANQIHVANVLNSSLLLGGWESTHGAFDVQTRQWIIPELAAEEAAFLTLYLAPDYGTQRTALQMESAVVEANQRNHTDETSATVSIRVTANRVDLELDHSTSSSHPTPQSEISYNTVLTNHSDHMATSIQVSHALPDGIAFTNAVGDGSYNPALALWTIPALAPMQSVTLTITGIVTWESVNTALTSEARLVDLDQVDTVESNNMANSVIEPIANAPELQLLQVVSNNTPSADELVAFTLLLSNGGQIAATNIQVSHLLGEGIDFVAADPQVGEYDKATGIWNIDHLRPGGSAGLIITGQIRADFTAERIESLGAIIGFDQGVIEPTNASASIIITPSNNVMTQASR